MGTSLVFLPLVRPFLSLPLPPPSPKEPTFRFSTSSRRKDIVRLRHEREPGGRDKAWLPRRGGGWSKPRGFFISVRSAKVLISGKPSADEIVSCFELPSLRMESRNAEGGSLEGGRERKNEWGLSLLNREGVEARNDEMTFSFFYAKRGRD